MSHILQAARILLATLREIFDEAAYERYLLRAGRETSPQAYAQFWRERDRARPRVKCC